MTHLHADDGPRTTVAMLTHNRRTEAARTLARLQKLPGPPPLLVVDNASRDGTREVVRAVAPRATYIRLTRNTGGAGRNAALAMARTPLVAFADDDTWWEPQALAIAEHAFDAEPRLAVVTARVLVGPEGRLDPTSALMAASPLPDDPPSPAGGRPILGFLAGASMLRRDAVLGVGGFCERMGIGGEEELLALDLAAGGWRLRYLADVTVHHFPSASRQPRRRRILADRNAIWTALLRWPPDLATRRVRAVIAEAYRDGVAGPVLAEAACGLPWAMRRRRRLPPAVENWLRLLHSGHLPDEGPDEFR